MLSLLVFIGFEMVYWPHLVMKCNSRIFSRTWRPDRSDRLQLQRRVILRTKRANIKTGYVARLSTSLPIQSLTLTAKQHQIRTSLLSPTHPFPPLPQVLLLI